MKKRIPLIIKGILLSFLFIFAFNLNLGQATYQTSDNSYTVQNSVEQFAEKGQSILMPIVLAEDKEEADFTVKVIPQKPKEVTELMEQAIKFIAVGATYVHRFFHPMINFFAFHTGNFLGTDYIYEGAMGSMLKNIWVVSRNIVNILFVLILLVLALKEIFWIKEEGSDLKKNLIKFVLLLVAVNFSWMATKVVLDAANVATNVVFSIPMGVSSIGKGMDDFEPCKVSEAAECSKNSKGEESCKIVQKLEGMCYPTEIYAPVTASGYKYFSDEECKKMDMEGQYSGKPDSAFDEKGEYNLNSPDSINWLQNQTTYCWGTIDFFKYNKNTSTIYLTYGMARIQNLVNSTADESIVQLSVGVLFSLLLQTVYVVALLAFFLALIVRMAFLWIFVAFSPFLIVLFYFGGYQKGIGEGDVQFSIEAFIKWAFVTVKVGAVFSVAFIMVSAGQAIGLKTPVGTGGVEVTGKLFKIKSLFMGMDTIQEFIWLLVTVVVLWGGVFAVLGKMPIVNMATNYIDGLGKRAGKWLATTPYWAPVMPMIDPNTQEMKYGSIESQYLGVKKLHDDWRQKLRYGEAGAAEYDKMNKAAIEIAADSVKRKSMVTLIDDGLLRGDNNAAHKFVKEYGIDVNQAHAQTAAFSTALKNSQFEPKDQQRALELVEKAYKRGPMGVEPKTAKTPAEREQDVKDQTRAINAAGGGGVVPEPKPGAPELPAVQPKKPPE